MEPGALTVRAKFYVSQVTAYKGSDGKTTQLSVKLNAVYSADPESENKAFWEATPAGTIEMSITNPLAFEHFVDGGEYYIDFTLAPRK